MVRVSSALAPLPGVAETQFSESTRLRYAVRSSRFPFLLSGHLIWRNLGVRYHAQLSYSVFGLKRVQTSLGRLTSSGLMPERFTDVFRSESAAQFNAPPGKISFSAGTPPIDLQPGAQDRLSVLIQLGARLAAQSTLPQKGATWTIQTAGTQTADPWTFAFTGQETQELPGGMLETVKLERRPRASDDQRVEVWLAPQLGFLPARIRLTDPNGEQIDQRWQASEAAPASD